ncbi:MAG: hypothetical protein RIS80_1286 [Actinomycetota bacterium]|jgi:glutaredoxin
MSEIKFYGADRCTDCRRSKALLNAEGVEFELNDVDANPAAATEAEAISGRMNIPVIQFADGLVLVEPSDDELRAALVERSLI